MSDLSRVYPNGSEKALGGQTGGLPEKNGSEKATNKGAHSDKVTDITV